MISLTFQAESHSQLVNLMRDFIDGRGAAPSSTPASPAPAPAAEKPAAEKPAKAEKAAPKVVAPPATKEPEATPPATSAPEAPAEITHAMIQEVTAKAVAKGADARAEVIAMLTNVYKVDKKAGRDLQKADYPAYHAAMLEIINRKAA